ncbi:MAG: hypothetical protein U0Q21_15010 [Dermatophilaceae bacterium]
MSTNYSRYADLPADRDYERMVADLRALPTPSVDLPAGRRAAVRSWLGRRHGASGMPVGRLHRA